MSFVRTGQNLNVQYRQLNGGFLSLRYMEIDDNCINFVRKFHIFCPPSQHCTVVTLLQETLLNIQQSLTFMFPFKSREYQVRIVNIFCVKSSHS